VQLLYLIENSKNNYKEDKVIYSKMCHCGGDIEINSDSEGKYHLACIQCSKEISKDEALGMLKKIQSSKVA
tara:strand:+ start:2858 stop:3070 length:213 start_codon:yes stop_codon:yes gene_type:complete